jgi:4-hydroxy-3-methylbut-2-enyl diphosphate reductase
MSENVKNEESFAELFEQYGSKTLNNGDIIEGTVVEVRNNEVIIDLGGFKYNGQLAADQLTDDPSLKPSDVVKEGDTIKVYVVGVNDAEGKVVLSRKKLVAMESWNKIKAAYESGEVLEGKIIKAVKGGVIALTEGSQVFIPARQAAERFVQDLQSLVGTTVSYKIIEIDERRKRVIGSVRVLLEAARKEREDKFWADVEEGKKYQGTVKSLTSFGAFVDIGGVDGLVHISELSWNKIKHPSEVVKEGDVLDVYIKDLNRETKKISLGFKKIEDNPWVIAQSKFNVGDVVKCKIVRMMPFGAFAEIIPNVDGLIHISQIADRRIGKPEDVLTIGEEVEAKITDANWEEKKISLSIRALIPVPEKEEVKEEAPAEAAPQKAEALVYSTDPEVEVEEVIEIEPADAE